MEHPEPPIKVKAYPGARGFSSITAAVRHAMPHPRLPDAKRDSARLHGAAFVDACWTWFDWMIRFDCDLTLHLWIEEREVQWALTPSTELCASSQFERVGSPPVVLDWINTIGPREMDRSSLIATRRGARFKDLFVSDHGLHLYLEDRLVLNFGMAQRISDAQFVIHAFEDE